MSQTSAPQFILVTDRDGDPAIIATRTILTVVRCTDNPILNALVYVGVRGEPGKIVAARNTVEQISAMLSAAVAS